MADNTFVNIGGHKVSAGVKYSTTEVKTGDVWIDGKPIYRRVFVQNGTWSDTVVSFDISSLNIDTIIKYDGSANGTTGGNPAQYPINRPSKAGTQFQLDTYYYNNARLDVTVGSGLNLSQIRLILEYTKTTD